MYDTLMQMGRWFGYRPGYLDACRLFITGELQQWYQYIAGAIVELRRDFDYMALVGGSPADFGLRVASTLPNSISPLQTRCGPAPSCRSVSRTRWSRRCFSSGAADEPAALAGW